MIFIEDVKAATADFFKISPRDLEAPGKRAPRCAARHAGMYVARELTQRPYRAISEAFGRTDHTTAIHGHRKVRAALGASETAQYVVAAIREAAIARADARRPPIMLPYIPILDQGESHACHD